MTLLERLAKHVIDVHPDHATTVLERLDADEVVEVLRKVGVASAARIVERLSPQLTTTVMHGFSVERSAKLLEALPVEVAARCVRRVDAERLDAMLALVETRRVRSIRTLLRFRTGSAGALMDPDVLALPQELTAREALQRVRKLPEFARYNVYVVDQGERLVGALNLRELLLARGRLLLADLMTRNPHCILATADRASLLAHPGWKEVHALPVVDEGGVYLGAVRYRVLRELEEELLAPRGEDVEAGAAFGQVIAAGARGLLDAVSGTREREPGRDPGGTE